MRDAPPPAHPGKIRSPAIVPAQCQRRAHREQAARAARVRRQGSAAAPTAHLPATASRRRHEEQLPGRVSSAHSTAQAGFCIRPDPGEVGRSATLGPAVPWRPRERSCTRIGTWGHVPCSCHLRSRTASAPLKRAGAGTACRARLPGHGSTARWSKIAPATAAPWDSLRFEPESGAVPARTGPRLMFAGARPDRSCSSGPGPGLIFAGGRPDRISPHAGPFQRAPYAVTQHRHLR